MKYLYSLFLVGMLPFAAWSQPTITSDWFPAEGHEISLQTFDSSTVDPGPAGANVTWDMSGAVVVDTIPPITQEYVDPSTTPYASEFPTATLASQSMTMGFSSYSYLRESGNQLEFLGVAFSQGSIVYTDPELLFEVPFTYQSSFQDDYVADVMVSFLDFTEYGDVDVTGDAYGTLILPEETFNNVLRIRRYNNSRDTVNLFGTSTININIDTTYQWVMEGYSSMILSYSATRSITLEYNQTTMQYDTTSNNYSESVIRDMNAGTTAIDDIDEESIDWSIYPNPVQDRLSVSWPDDIEVDRIRIADLKGSVMQVEQIPDGQSNMDILLDRSLGHGMYFLTLESHDGTVLGQKRFVRNR